MKNFLLLFVVVVGAFWWLRRETPPDDPSPLKSRTAVTAPVTTGGNRPAVPQPAPPEQTLEAERQRRKALADEYARLRAQSEAKEAAYKDAMAAYEAKRNAISEQIDALGRSNKNGVNNALMDQLTEQRLRIPLPQRP